MQVGNKRIWNLKAKWLLLANGTQMAISNKNKSDNMIIKSNFTPFIRFKTIINNTKTSKDGILSGDKKGNIES